MPTPLFPRAPGGLPVLRRGWWRDDRFRGFLPSRPSSMQEPHTGNQTHTSGVTSAIQSFSIRLVQVPHQLEIINRSSVLLGLNLIMHKQVFYCFYDIVWEQGVPY